MYTIHNTFYFSACSNVRLCKFIFFVTVAVAVLFLSSGLYAAENNYPELKSSDDTVYHEFSDQDKRIELKAGERVKANTDLIIPDNKDALFELTKNVTMMANSAKVRFKFFSMSNKLLIYASKGKFIINSKPRGKTFLKSEVIQVKTENEILTINNKGSYVFVVDDGIFKLLAIEPLYASIYVNKKRIALKDYEYEWRIYKYKIEEDASKKKKYTLEDEQSGKISAYTQIKSKLFEWGFTAKHYDYVNSFFDQLQNDNVEEEKPKEKDPGTRVIIPGKYRRMVSNTNNKDTDEPEGTLRNKLNSDDIPIDFEGAYICFINKTGINLFHVAVETMDIDNGTPSVNEADSQCLKINSESVAGRYVSKSGNFCIRINGSFCRNYHIAKRSSLIIQLGGFKAIGASKVEVKYTNKEGFVKTSNPSLLIPGTYRARLYKESEINDSELSSAKVFKEHEVVIVPEKIKNIYYSD